VAIGVGLSLAVGGLVTSAGDALRSDPAPLTVPALKAGPQDVPTAGTTARADNTLATTTVAQTAVTTPATTPPATSPPASHSASQSETDAAALLALIPVELEHRGGYDRDLFAVWSDLDGDGCNTRAEVLQAESVTPLATGPSCTVTGEWISSYDGVRTSSPNDLDVDHLVPLDEAWDSGAWAWTVEQRIAFGNDTSDPRTLIAVTADSNRTKGNKDPSNWIPDNDYLCTYVADWIAVKARWSLTMDPSEHGRLRNLLRDRCPSLTVGPSRELRAELEPK
jgi:hypothetical protein